MTREEAKDFLTDISYKLGNMSVEYLTEKDGETMREAVKVLEQDRMAIEALEKDIPKTPKKSDAPRYGMGYEYYDWYCPTCNKFLAFECDTERQHIHHCKCGQRLDWGCEDDKR